MSDSASSVELITSLTKLEMATACGLQMEQLEFTELKQSLAELDTIAFGMYDELAVVRDLVDCPKVSQMYSTLVYDAVCINGVGGLTWVFATMTAVAIMAILMVTFLAALFPVQEGSIDYGTAVVRPPVRRETIDRGVEMRALSGRPRCRRDHYRGDASTSTAPSTVRSGNVRTYERREMIYRGLETRSISRSQYRRDRYRGDASTDSAHCTVMSSSVRPTLREAWEN